MRTSGDAPVCSQTRESVAEMSLGVTLQLSAEPSLVGELAGLNKKRKNLVFAALAVNSTLLAICFSILQPVFPVQVKQMFPSQGHSGIVGTVFSVPTITQLVTLPIISKELTVVGPRRLLILGLFLVGGEVFLFAFVCRVYDWSAFLVLCFSLRITEGLGRSMAAASSFAILAGMFPDQITRMTGLLEMFVGLGYLLGPGLGGVLYDHLGFEAPFMAESFFLLVGLLFIWCSLPKTADGPRRAEEKISFRVLLRVPRIALLVFALVLGLCSLTFCDSTFGPYLHNNFGFSASEVGGTFLLVSAAYGLSSPFVGHFAEKYNLGSVFIPLGAFLMAFGYQLVSPSLFFNLRPSIGLLLPGGSVVGLGVGFLLIPCPGGIVQTARVHGFEDSLILHSTVGGLVTAALSLGVTIGPPIGGTVTEEFNFNDPLSVLGGILFLYGLVVVLQTDGLMSFLQRLCKYSRVGGEDTERTPVIPIQKD